MSKHAVDTQWLPLREKKREKEKKRKRERGRQTERERETERPTLIG